MADFVFGSGSVSVKTKPSQAKKIVATDSLVCEKIVPNIPHFIFLVDHKPSAFEKKHLISDIEGAGIFSYVIQVAVQVEYDPDTLKSGLCAFINANKSDWEKYIDYNGVHCAGIMTFGNALYAITKCTDIMVDDFYAADFVPSYIYIGHGYCTNCDCHVIPVDKLEFLYPVVAEDPVHYVNWKTRFFKKQLKLMKSRDLKVPDLTPIRIHTLKTKEECAKVLANNMNAEAVAYDTETTGLDCFADKVGCFTVTWNGVDGYYLPWDLVNKRQLVANLQSCKKRLTQNGKYDLKIMWTNGMAPHTCYPTDDTLMLAQVLHSDRHHGLKSLAFYYTPFGGYDNELDVFKKNTRVKNYCQIPIDILSKYAVIDAIVTYRVYFAQMENMDEIDRKFPNDKMPEWTLRRWYEEITMPVYGDYIDMEYRGVVVDREMQIAGQNELKAKINELRKKMAEAWNVTPAFEFDSTKKLGKLFQDLGWPAIELAKDGTYGTSDSVLIEYKRLGKPGIDEIQKYRTLQKFLQTYLGVEENDDRGWNEFIKYSDFGEPRVHPNFGVFANTSLRNNCHEPNMQQLPVHDPDAQAILKMVSVPWLEEYTIETDDGRVFTGVDDDFLNTDRGIIRFSQVTEDTVIYDYYTED